MGNLRQSCTDSESNERLLISKQCLDI